MPDTTGFLDAVAGLPEQLAAAHEQAADAIDRITLPLPEEIDNVAVLGMGGAALAGDVFAATLDDQFPMPVQVIRQYRPPAWIGSRTIAFACSYSGTTEETLAMAQAAAASGAFLVAVSAGGPLAELARKSGGVHVPCPEGLVPRAAIGALVAPLFVTAYRLGIAPGAHAHLVETQEQLASRRSECHPGIAAPKNPAREIARRIDRTIPLFYGGGPVGRVAAYRWKCEFNENAKAPAFWNAYPELDHNEIVGWGQHGDVTRQIFTLVELRHGYEHEQVRKRFEVTRSVVAEVVHQVLDVEAKGEGRLAQLMDSMYVGTWASCYLALDNDVDPGPVPTADDVAATIVR